MAWLAKATLLTSALLSTRVLGQCNSYGIDYHNGGSYFQNISSPANFTFVSIFEGCQNDVANNILVDPNGDEYQCTDTPLQPDDTNEISTCPMAQNVMFSGDWSVLIISNNGDSGAPIAYERDFYLTLGTPVTTTFTPTVTLPVTTTPIVNVTVTTTFTNTITTVVTTTVPSRTISPTTTVTPAKTTITVTKTMGTVTKTGHAVSVTLLTKIHTASCSIPSAQSTPDPTATITPSLVTAAALSTSASKAKFRRIPNAEAILDRDARIAERKANLARNRKRSPDSATVTVTDTNTADYVTTTSTSTAPASTMTITTVATVSTTTTSTSTIVSGVTVKSVVTVTAATPTITKTTYTVATITPTTITKTQTVTITSTYIPAASTAACSAKGGSWV